MDKNETRSVKIILWVSIALLIIPLIGYILWFRLSDVSDKPDDWATFSSYWSAFIYLVNTVIVAGLTYLLYIYNQNRDAAMSKLELDSRRREEKMERPVVTFRKFKNEAYYTLSNVGKGVALNIVIKTFHTKVIVSHTKNEISTYNYCTDAYALREGENEPMRWTTNCDAIAAIYNDIFGNTFYSYMAKDKLCIFPHNVNDIEKYFKQYNECTRVDCENYPFSWLNVVLGKKEQSK